jgi:AbrB family looped-hinge helix DNA binding protein
MADVTTIDAAGRVVIPKPLRDSLRLLPNTRLRVVEQDRRVVLEPIEDEPILIEKDGLVLIGGELVGPLPDARSARDQRVRELTRRAMQKPRRR